MTERETTDLLVLVADDDDLVRDVVREILEDAGFRTITARNGDEAIRLAREHQPALILLDVMMPRMDGYTTLARLREYPATKDVPVIVLTGRTNPGFRELSSGVGASAHVTKPVLPDELLQTMRRLIGEKVS